MSCTCYAKPFRINRYSHYVYCNTQYDNELSQSMLYAKQYSTNIYNYIVTNKLEYDAKYIAEVVEETLFNVRLRIAGAKWCSNFNGGDICNGAKQSIKLENSDTVVMIYESFMYKYLI
jgi:hypothetical protein